MSRAGAPLLAGLIGAGIQRSLTPALQEEEARQHGLRLHYQRIDLDATPGAVEQLPALLAAARIMGFAGLNITYPCKQAVLPLLDELSPEARAIGAVNTVVVRAGRLVGHNTDGSGWAWGFRRALPDADLGCVVLLGAGGAGSAIADALLRLGAGQLRIVDTDPARARALAAALNARHVGGGNATVGPSVAAAGTAVAQAESDAAQALAGATGLVHATPVGMARFPGMALSPSLLRPSLWVSEVVYVPIETGLLKAARLRGCRAVDGGSMAVGQAVGAFELFTGIPADAGRMERHFHRLLAAAASDPPAG